MASFYGQNSENARKEARRYAQSRAVVAKTNADNEFFWHTVLNIFTNYNHSTGPPCPRGGPRLHELFKRQGATGINFKDYDEIEVTRSGPNSEACPPLESFHDLAGMLPDFLNENLTGSGEKGM